MDKKESKKGFWSTLFAPKKKSCCCNSNIIVENEVKPVQSCDSSGESGSGAKVSEVLVLGPGCAKCKSTYAVVERVIRENNLDVKFSKVEDIEQIMRYNIMTTPAVVVDGKVILKGKVPSESEIRQLLGIS